MGFLKPKKGSDPYNVLGFWPSWILPLPTELADKKHLEGIEERARALGKLPPKKSRRRA